MRTARWRCPSSGSKVKGKEMAQLALFLELWCLEVTGHLSVVTICTIWAACLTLKYTCPQIEHIIFFP